MDTVLRITATALGLPVLIAVLLLFNVLQVVYFIDLVLGGWLLVLIFAGPLILTVIWWAALAAYAPLGVAMSDESSTAARVLGLAVTPGGVVGAFLLWQAQNWVVYGLLNADPDAYNWVFERIGLAI